MIPANWKRHSCVRTAPVTLLHIRIPCCIKAVQVSQRSVGQGTGKEGLLLVPGVFFKIFTSVQKISFCWRASLSLHVREAFINKSLWYWNKISWYLLLKIFQESVWSAAILILLTEVAVSAVCKCLKKGLKGLSYQQETDNLHERGVSSESVTSPLLWGKVLR